MSFCNMESPEQSFLQLKFFYQSLAKLLFLFCFCKFFKWELKIAQFRFSLSQFKSFLIQFLWALVKGPLWIWVWTNVQIPFIYVLETRDGCLIHLAGRNKYMSKETKIYNINVISPIKKRRRLKSQRKVGDKWDKIVKVNIKLF